MCRREDGVVCVTGASGYLGAQIVKRCLLKGWRVRATVRNAADSRKTQHLTKLDFAATHLELLSAEMGAEKSTGFEEAFAGCSAVFHTASPFSGGMLSSEDVHVAVFGTLAVLRASKQAGVKTVVMTSAMCAAAPEVEGEVLCEKHWADPKIQVASGNKWAASKILAERAAWEMVSKEKPQFRLVTILPSFIVGPGLRNHLDFTNLVLLSMMKTGWQGDVYPDESLCFVDVRDCAAQHIAAMEQESASGRYFSTAHCVHWNDMGVLLQDTNPNLAMARLCSDPCDATLIDRTQQDSLGVPVREIPEIISDAARFFRKLGMKDAMNFVTVSSKRCSVEMLDASRRCSVGKRSSVCTNPWLAFTQCDDSGH